MIFSEDAWHRVFVPRTHLLVYTCGWTEALLAARGTWNKRYTWYSCYISIKLYHTVATSLTSYQVPGIIYSRNVVLVTRPDVLLLRLPHYFFSIARRDGSLGL